ncbi:predicted protein [Postia placenta Mad-698-R]|nr:predicted protein [Postia placenta Mad-698-R]
MHSTPSPTIPGNFDRDEEDKIDQELQDNFDEELIPSTAEERTSSPELLGLTTSDYATSTPDLFDQSGSSPEPEDPFPSTSNLPPIASFSQLSVIPTSDLAPPPPLAPSNAASNSNPAPPAPTIPVTTTASSSSPAPTNTTNMSQNTNTPLMPPRGHSTAPSFDPSEVHSLRCYFQDLKALFTRCQITNEAAKKQWAVWYPSIDIADLWETIESFIDVAKSYNDWKADVRALYPGADDTRKWSLADMDQLIGERACIGIHNAADLGCYYRDFMAITKHLIAQHRLSTIEQSSGHSRQPKIGEPPAFKGSEDKTKLEEWLDLIVLWCEHEGVATDKQRIVTALSKLQGPAHQYMKSYYVKMREGKDLGTWKAFVAELAQIYGQRDNKEGAKKEITALFINKDLASKDFVKYAERFRTLGRLTEYDDSLLIDKLREVIPRDMRLVLAGKDESTLPKDWTLFLDILLNINKIVNPEKARGSVFKNSGLDNGGAVPMDIDSAEKSKSKVGQKCGQAAEDPRGWR